MLKIKSKLKSLIADQWLARAGLVSVVNTISGMSMFPIAKTLFPDLPNPFLIIATYCACVALSFFLHGKYSFRAALSVQKFLYFVLANLLTVSLLTVLVIWVHNFSALDIRIVHPGIAVLLQVIAVMFYKSIFIGIKT